MTFLLGLVAGIIGTLAVGATFMFLPEQLKSGVVAVLRFFITGLMPFGVERRLRLSIGATRATLNGEGRLLVRLDDRREMIIRDKNAKYSFSPWHLVPSCLVRAAARSSVGIDELTYGPNSTYRGSVLRIDRNVSIFTLDKASMNARLEYWGRTPKFPFSDAAKAAHIESVTPSGDPVTDPDELRRLFS